jgi:hypothetical protein
MAIIVSLSLINIVGSDIIVDMILIVVASSVIILSVSQFLTLISLFDVFLSVLDNPLFIKSDKIDQTLSTLLHYRLKDNRFAMN